jgi:phosphatidylglycerophosphate synthase
MTVTEVASGYIVGRNGIRLWGLDGAERLARQLRSAGVAGVLRGEDPPPAHGSVVLLRSDYLFEDRTIADLLRQPGVLITASAGDQHAPVVAAHVPCRDLAAARAVLEGTGDPRAIPGVVTQSPESLTTSLVRKLHKAAPPVVLPARPDRAAALERHLFDGSYKGVTDLVTKWVWPAPARAVTAVCARLGIPPNAVTTVSFALVVIATVLFAEGRFGAGLALAWVMTFLDTVDGKLARVTVTSTPFGHYFDHSIDSVHPPIWYIAWAWGMTGGLPGIWPLVPLLAALLVAYLAGRFIETVFKHFVGGCSIFTWRPFDSYFRLVLARRNPNLLLLTASYLVGMPAAGLTAVAIWTVLSSIVLAVRLVQGLLVRGRGGSLRPWLEELGDEARAVPPWARPFVADLAAVRHLVQ